MGCLPFGIGNMCIVFSVLVEEYEELYPPNSTPCQNPSVAVTDQPSDSYNIESSNREWIRTPNIN